MTTTLDTTAPRALVEAAAWRTHLTEAGVDSSADFESWLAADERHAVAWRQVQAPWELFGEHAASPELLDVRRAALSAARSAGRQRWRGGGLFGYPRLAVAAVLILMLGGGFLAWTLQGAENYRTASGERRMITLPDGSRVTLDSQSELKVRYSREARQLVLNAGQARFDVAADVERPFAVFAGGQKVVALGTAFNVDVLTASKVVVTLLEGKVAVLPQSSASASLVTLAPGQQLLASSQARPRIVQANLERTTAWQSGRLIFENEPLSSVAARVSRYTSRPLRLADEQTAALRISGVFNAGDLDGFVATITSYLPVDVASRDDDGVVLRHQR